MTTNESLHIVCPACLAVNRVPVERLSQAPKCGQCHQQLFSGRPLDLYSGSFDKHVLRNEIPVVVDFWAAWCGPCKMMAPAFFEAAQKLEPLVRLAKLDTEAEPQISARFNIRSIPTLIVFQRGREIARQSGAMPVQEIIRWVKGCL
ncbi:MAG: thioredoxin TrxC [Gammaproteobacteria bacterium]